MVDMLDAEISSPQDEPDKRPQLVSFHDEKEVSAGFYPDQLGLFLWRLVPHIKEDFSGEQIQRLIHMVDSMVLEDTREVPSMVTFRGRRVPFNIRIYKYAAESSSASVLYLRTTATLATIFEDELKVFFGPPTSAAETIETSDPRPHHIHIHES